MTHGSYKAEIIKMVGFSKYNHIIIILDAHYKKLLSAAMYMVLLYLDMCIVEH